MINNHTYLYVEDDPMSREALHVILTRVMKLERVYIFPSSEDFLTRVKSLPHRPDVFLLDIHVSPYDGFEMLQMVREDVEFKDATVIALTASVMNEEVDRLKSSGFNSVISKPIRVSIFPQLIQRILDGESIWNIIDA